MSNELGRKYFLKHYLKDQQNFSLPKTLQTLLQTAKKVFVTQSVAYFLNGANYN
jgi:hypothetical protein